MGTGGQTSRSKTFVDDADTIIAAFLNEWLQDGLITLTGDVRDDETAYEVEHYGVGTAQEGAHSIIHADKVVIVEESGGGHDWYWRIDGSAGLCLVGPGSRSYLFYNLADLIAELDPDGNLEIAGEYKYQAATARQRRVNMLHGYSELGPGGPGWIQDAAGMWTGTADAVDASHPRCIIPLDVPADVVLSWVEVLVHFEAIDGSAGSWVFQLMKRDSDDTSWTVVNCVVTGGAINGGNINATAANPGVDYDGWIRGTPVLEQTGTDDTEWAIGIYIMEFVDAEASYIYGCRTNLTHTYVRP